MDVPNASLKGPQVHAKSCEHGSVVQQTAPHLAAKRRCKYGAVRCACTHRCAKRLVTVLQGRPSHTSALDALLPPQQLGLLPGLQAEPCSQLSSMQEMSAKLWLCTQCETQAALTPGTCAAHSQCAVTAHTLAFNPPVHELRPISHVIHQTWSNTSTLEAQSRRLNSWRATHPHWEYK